MVSVINYWNIFTVEIGGTEFYYKELGDEPLMTVKILANCEFFISDHQLVKLIAGETIRVPKNIVNVTKDYDKFFKIIVEEIKTV